MIISQLPGTVYKRALELAGFEFEPSQDFWGFKEEWELRVDRQGYEDGELTQAICEHITQDGYTIK